VEQTIEQILICEIFNVVTKQKYFGKGDMYIKIMKELKWWLLTTLKLEIQKEIKGISGNISSNK